MGYRYSNNSGRRLADPRRAQTPNWVGLLFVASVVMGLWALFSLLEAML